MKIRVNHFVSAYPGRALSAALSFGLCLGAWADPNPYYAGASVAYNHDSNVFRTPTAISDNYSSTGLLAGFDQPIGRQRVYADVSVNSNRFKKLGELDNTSYSLTGGLDWSTVHKISGSLKLSERQNLASFTTSFNAVPIQVRNIEKSRELVARLKYGMEGLLSLEGSASHRELSYSASAYQVNNYDLNVGSFGIKYRPSEALTAGAAIRVSRGHYPNQINSSGQAAELQREDIDFTTRWIATGQSSVDARISVGRRSDDSNSLQKVSDPTGELVWLFRPTGKLSFKTSLIRDTGIETNYLTTAFGQTIGTGNNNRLTSTASLATTYSATAKIQLTANAGYVYRSLKFTPQSSLPAIEGSDNLARFTLGTSYAPTRNSLLSCSVGRELRRTDSVLSYAYSANTAACSAQFTVQ